MIINEDNNPLNGKRSFSLQRIRGVWWKIADFFAPLEARVLARVHTRGWMSYKIKKKVKETQISNNVELNKRKKEIAWRITRKSDNPLGIVLFHSLVIFGPQVVIWCLGTIIKLPSPLFFENHIFDNEVRFSAEILASLLGLFFVLAVFLFESIRGKDFEEKLLPVYIEETNIKQRIFFGLISLLSMVFIYVSLKANLFIIVTAQWISLWNLLIFLINIIYLLKFLWTTIDLIDPNKLEILLLTRLRSSTSTSTISTIEKRVWSYLIHKIEDSHQYASLHSFSGYKKRTNWEIVRLDIKDRNQSYQIKDLNLKLIQVAAKRAYEMQGDNPSKIRILSQHWDRINYENPGVGLIPTKVDRPRIVELLKKAYRIKPLDTKDQFENDLSYIKDMTIKAIKSGKSNQADRLLSQFAAVIEEFLLTMESQGVAFSYESAQKDSGIFSEWTPVSSVQQYYVKIIKETISAGNDEIIRQALLFPFTMMSLSVRHYDHLCFQYFARAYIHIYHLGVKSNLESALKEYVTHRGWKAIAYFYNLEIQPRLSADNVDQSRLESLGDYSIFLLGILSELMKTSLDYGYYSDFKNIGYSLKEIGHWLGGRSPIRYVENGVIPPEDSADRDKLMSVGKQLLRIKVTKRQALFGMGGWLIHLFESNKLEKDTFNDLVGEIITELHSIEDISSIYSSIFSNEKPRRLFNWDWWELGERPGAIGEPTFHPMRFDSWLSKTYAYLCVLFIPADEARAPKLEPQIRIERIYKDLLVNLQEFENNDIWKDAFNEMGADTYLEKKRILIAIHQEAIKQQELKEEEETIIAALSESKVSQFSKDLNDTWNRISIIRSVVNKQGRYKLEKTILPEDLEPIQLRYFEPKGVFIEQSKVSYIDWGGGVGRELARLEDFKLIQEFKLLPTAYEGVGIEELESALITCIQELKEAGKNPIILFSNPEIRVEVRQSDRFVPEWMSRTPSDIFGIEGYYDETQMVNIDSISQDEVIIVDMHEFADLVQYPPNESGQYPLSLLIETITEERARGLLEEFPGFPRDPRTKEQLEGENAVRWFMKKVSIEVSERIRFENINNEAGAIIKINLENTENE